MSSFLMRYSVLYELNTLDACWIAVDEWSNSSRCRVVWSTCFGRDAYILDHRLDILITMLNSVNCSTVICSPTVEYLCSWEKRLVKPMAPGALSHHINLHHFIITSRAYFLPWYLCNSLRIIGLVWPTRLVILAMGEVLSFGFDLAVSFPSDRRGSKARIVLLLSRITRWGFYHIAWIYPSTSCHLA